MIRLFDTSSLIPALLERHSHHERVFPAFNETLNVESNLAVSAHCLAEMYASLTAMQVAPLATIGAVHTAIHDNILSRFLYTVCHANRARSV